jgi:hypothetical protein
VAVENCTVFDLGKLVQSEALAAGTHGVVRWDSGDSVSFEVRAEEGPSLMLLLHYRSSRASGASESLSGSKPAFEVTQVIRLEATPTPGGSGAGGCAAPCRLGACCAAGGDCTCTCRGTRGTSGAGPATA